MMNDYKKLVAELRKWQTLGDAPVGNGFGVIVDKLTLKQAADAIEQLVAECNRLQSVYDEIDKAHHDTFLMYCKMKHERDAATDCIYAVQDSLYRVGGNDYAEGIIEQWEKEKGGDE